MGLFLVLPMIITVDYRCKKISSTNIIRDFHKAFDKPKIN